MVLEDENLSTFLNQKETAKVLSIFYRTSSKILNMDCKDSSAVNSTNCSSREPRLDSQPLHDPSQPSVFQEIWCPLLAHMVTKRAIGTQKSMQVKISTNICKINTWNWKKINHARTLWYSYTTPGHIPGEI